jgi:HEXXH motif-containing protein
MTHRRVWFDVSPVYADRPDFVRDFGDYSTAEGLPSTLAPAVELIDCWRVGAAQARAVIRVLHPAYEPGREAELEVDSVLGVVASSSHSYADQFGSLWATVDSPVGVAEAIVHEMAHHKLRALGVWFETADRIVANLPTECYPSPILGGRARPMPAVLHAHYALLHMVALELEILAAGPTASHPSVAALLQRHCSLLRAGDVILWRNLVVDEVGARFLPPVREWQTSLLGRSEVYR